MSNYSLKESFNKLLREVVSVDGGLAFSQLSPSTSQLKTVISSTNTDVLTVSSVNGLVSLMPAATTLIGASSNNVGVLSTSITNGNLSLTLSPSIVTSVVSEDPDTVVSIINNKLSFLRNNSFPRAMTIGQQFNIGKNDYMCRVDGVLTSLCSSNVHFVNDALDSANTAIIYILPIDSLRSTMLKTFMSASAYMSQLQYLKSNNTLDINSSFGGLAGACAIPLGVTDFLATSPSNPITHYGDYTIFLGGSFVVGDGASIFKFKNSDTFINNVLKKSAVKANSLDYMGNLIPYVFGAKSVIFIVVSGEGRVGGLEVEVYINGVMVAFSHYESDDFSPANGPLSILSEDSLVSNGGTAALTTFGVLDFPFDRKNITEMYNFFKLDAQPTQQEFLQFDYNPIANPMSSVTLSGGVVVKNIISVITPINSSQPASMWSLQSTSEPTSPTISVDNFLIFSPGCSLETPVALDSKYLAMPMTICVDIKTITPAISAKVLLFNLVDQNAQQCYLTADFAQNTIFLTTILMVAGVSTTVVYTVSDSRLSLMALAAKTIKIICIFDRVIVHSKPVFSWTLYVNNLNLSKKIIDYNGVSSPPWVKFGLGNSVAIPTYSGNFTLLNSKVYSSALSVSDMDRNNLRLTADDFLG